MRKLNVVITHGIGWGEKRETYADQLQQNIEKSFRRALKQLDLPVERPKRGEGLRFRVVFWSPVTQEPQNRLIDLLELEQPSDFWLERLIYEARRQMIGLVGDIIAYSGSQDLVYQEIHFRVHEALHDLVDALDDDDRDEHGLAHLTLIGHSLGSVITSDFIWDNRDTEPGREHILADYDLNVKNIILLGSPMAMYTLRGNPDASKEELAESLDSPVTCDPDNGLWLNMFDPQDAVGLPLTPIDAYANIGVVDCSVNAGNWATGWNPASHVGYWNSNAAADIIGRKLALDWAALNDPAFAAQHYTAQVEAYRASLCPDEHDVDDDDDE